MSSTPQTVSIPYALEQSEKGLYFIGQTPLFTGTTEHALVSLENPHCSNMNIYLNAITVTNISGPQISAEVYLKSALLNGSSSNLISCVNTALIPSPPPEAEIHWIPSAVTSPSSGIPIFSRIIPSSTTVVIDGGQIIIGPGQSLLLYLGGYLPIMNNSLIVAFGWWEEDYKTCIHY